MSKYDGSRTTVRSRGGAPRLLSAFLGGDMAANASLGVVLVVACAVVQACSVEAVHPTAHGLATFLLAAAASVVVVLPLWRLPWPALPPRGLLVFPLVAIGSLTTASVLAGGIGNLYGGFFLLSFVYVGLTQPPGTSCVCAVAALPAWVLVEGHMSAAVDVKMPITVILWVLVGELLAQRVRSQERATDELAVAASTDPLTTLRSRRELDRSLAGTAPGDAVVMIDLDGFKRVNDEHGHQAGDGVLADFGRAIVGGMRSGDVALRYGGDEVLLVLTRAGFAGAETFLERLRSDWERPGRPSFSAGVAVHRAGDAPAGTLGHADDALYAAKRAGGGTATHEARLGARQDH